MNDETSFSLGPAVGQVRPVEWVGGGSGVRLNLRY